MKLEMPKPKNFCLEEMDSRLVGNVISIIKVPKQPLADILQKVLLKISQYSWEDTCVGVSF